MSKYSDLLSMMKEGQVDKAMERMYLDNELQKISAIEFRKWSSLNALISWEDVLCESIKRLVDKALNGTNIWNFKLYYWGICRNYCQEMHRLSQKNEQIGNHSADDRIDALHSAIKPYVDRLGGQCKLLMYLLYFHNPAYDPKQREVLVEILKKKGYEVKTSSLSSIISRCKRNLKQLIGDQLDDFDEQHNF